jgi:GH35 family endo-1,4-beta-xylanase
MSSQSRLSRRSFLAASSAAVAGAAMGVHTGAAEAQEVPSLWEVYKNDFLIGTAIDRPNALNAREQEAIKKHFSALTPENSMKPQPIHPQENQYSWAGPDGLVNWCLENKITVIGHTLVWHAQTANWFFTGGNRDQVIGRLKEHIHTVVGRYKGKIKGWDVVNEAINDGGGGGENLRASQWRNIVGPEFLTLAFNFAHEADPNMDLHYNDYNIESGGKHQASLVLLRRLINETPITHVGIQGHWSVTGLNARKLEEIEQAIVNYKNLKLKVAITELDVTMTGQGGGQLGGGGGRGGGAATPQALQAQAEVYAKLFQIFLRHREAIDRVTFWGLNDQRSWRAGQSPLFLDGQNNPKPALFAIAEAGAGGTTRPVIQRSSGGPRVIAPSTRPTE